MSYPRNLYSQLTTDLDNNQVIVITGMRRVGKTTALHHLYDLINSPNKAYFDLEHPLTRKLFELENYDAILPGLKDSGINSNQRAFIFLDEIQNLPAITKVIKYLHDHYQTKFFVTGSSSYYLKNLFPESLAGRKFTYQLHPLSFSEFLIFKNITHTPPTDFTSKASNKNYVKHTKLLPFYQEYLEYGGFPQVVLTENTTKKKQLLLDTFKSYFEHDVKHLADFQDLGKLRDLILLLTSRVSSNIDTTKLSSELAISRDTLYNYLTFLESTYFISLVSKHSHSIDRQTAGEKKVYFCDSGLIKTIGSPSIGQLLEQSIFQNLRPSHTLNYYRTKQGGEIDFVLDKKIALEVKKHASKRDLANLKKRMDSAKLTEGYIASRDFVDDLRVILATDL